MTKQIEFANVREKREELKEKVTAALNEFTDQTGLIAELDATRTRLYGCTTDMSKAPPEYYIVNIEVVVPE